MSREGVNITRYLGLDVGDVRIGVALSDPLGILASPHSIVVRAGGNSEIDAIMDIITKNGVGDIVVGLPISMDGTIGSQAAKTKEFVGLLVNRTNIPIHYQDERLSTVEAKRMVREARKPGRDERYDAAAAALILQDFLNARAPLDIQEEDPLI